MADWLSAIGSLFSAIAAFFSLAAFLYAMKMQREDSINDVRPELLLLDWSLEDEEFSNTGLCTSINAARIKNVGRGPDFDTWSMSIDPGGSKSVKSEITFQLKLKTAHLIGGDLGQRKRLSKRISELYDTKQPRKINLTTRV